MDMVLKSKVDLMVENYQKLKSDFIWEASLLKHFCAMMYATRGKKVDIDKIKEIKMYIKDKKLVFNINDHVKGWTSDPNE